MIVSRILGGLGNQLFQYAFGYGIAQEHGYEFSVDFASFEGYGLRQYKLNSFQVDAPAVDEARYPVEEASAEGFTKARRGLRSVLERELPPDSERVLRTDDLLLIGYWQKFRYVQNIEPLLRKQFQLAESPGEGNLRLIEKARDCVSVALHVRRGDYVTNRRALKAHGLCSPDYYQNAVRQLQRQFENVTVFLFSDDLEWVAKNVRLPCLTVAVEGNGADKDHEELWVMASCRHFVIANSTFSWWAAWLGDNPDKKVIAPTPWLADRRRTPEGVILPEWQLLPARPNLLARLIGGRFPFQR